MHFDKFDFSDEVDRKTSCTGGNTMISDERVMEEIEELHRRIDVLASYIEKAMISLEKISRI